MGIKSLVVLLRCEIKRQGITCCVEAMACFYAEYKTRTHKIGAGNVLVCDLDEQSHALPVLLRGSEIAKRSSIVLQRPPLR